MKPSIKKILSVFMAMLFTFTGFSFSANAESSKFDTRQILNVKTESQLIEFQEKIKFASESELQEMINIVEKSVVNYNNTDTKYSDIIAWKSAWLAAAQIARKKGYPAAATLVEHSVFNRDYNENNGFIARKIKNTRLFNTMVRNRYGSDRFTKSIDSDLYYAIHKFDYYTSSSSRGARVRVTDTFDFHLETSYKDLFTNIVNNWALLHQGLGVLNRIDVRITIDA